MTTTVRSCPRCTREYNEAHPAVSRATPDSDIEICGPCGGDEVTGRGIVLVAHWPISPTPLPEVPTNDFADLTVGDVVFRRTTLPGGEQFGMAHTVAEVHPGHIVDTRGVVVLAGPEVRWTIIARGPEEGS